MKNYIHLRLEQARGKTDEEQTQILINLYADMKDRDYNHFQIYTMIESCIRENTVKRNKEYNEKEESTEA